jgi:hypothetical protein
MLLSAAFEMERATGKAWRCQQSKSDYLTDVPLFNHLDTQPPAKAVHAEAERYYAD